MSRIEITVAQYNKLVDGAEFPLAEDTDMVRLETVAGGNMTVTLVTHIGNWVDGFEVNPDGDL